MRFAPVIVLLTLATSAQAQEGPIQLRDQKPMTKTEEQVVRRFLPAILKIQIIHERSIGTGTGFFISPDGLAVTNKHVLQGLLLDPKAQVQITVPSKAVSTQKWTGQSKSSLWSRFEEGAKTYDQIRIISCGKSEGRDICVFKVDTYTESYLRLSKGFPSEQTKVFTIGIPGGNGFLVDEGVFLDRRNYNGVSEVLTSIETRHGNSGGPLFTEDGTVIGVVRGRKYWIQAAPGVGEMVTKKEFDGISAYEVQEVLDHPAQAGQSFTPRDFSQLYTSGFEWYEF